MNLREEVARIVAKTSSSHQEARYHHEYICGACKADARLGLHRQAGGADREGAVRLSRTLLGR